MGDGYGSRYSLKSYSDSYSDRDTMGASGVERSATVVVPVLLCCALALTCPARCLCDGFDLRRWLRRYVQHGGRLHRHWQVSAE